MFLLRTPYISIDLDALQIESLQFCRRLQAHLLYIRCIENELGEINGLQMLGDCFCRHLDSAIILSRHLVL